MTTSLGRPVVGTSSFRHDELPHPVTHIRILEVLPSFAGENSTVQCRTKNVRLVEYDSCYAALSYHHGGGEANHLVSINGQMLGIKQNLYTFLRAFRSKLTSKQLPAVFLWIDVLCLDISNLEERNSQVQIIPSIYQKAKAVLIWINPHDDKGRRESLNSEVIVGKLEQMRRDLDLLPDDRNDARLTKKYLVLDDQSAIARDIWQRVLQLYNDEYWTRLWIVQETHFGRDLLFMTGDSLLAWQQFRAPLLLSAFFANRFCNSGREGEYDLLKTLFDSRAMSVIRPRLNVRALENERVQRYMYSSYLDAISIDQSISSARLSLESVLVQHRHRICSEEIDKIYALVGMCDMSLPIDHTRTQTELFAATILSLPKVINPDFVQMVFTYLCTKSGTRNWPQNVVVQRNAGLVQYRSICKDVISMTCDTIISVRVIPKKMAIHDTLSTLLKVTNIKCYQVVVAATLATMHSWYDFSDPDPQTLSEQRTLSEDKPICSDPGSVTATPYPVLLSNPSSKNKHKTVLTIVMSTSIQTGDIVVSDASMHNGLLIRIDENPRRAVIVGTIMFLRKATVEALSKEKSTSGSLLSDFCTLSEPTPFTITDYDGEESLVTKPHTSRPINHSGHILKQTPKSTTRAHTSRPSVGRISTSKSHASGHSQSSEKLGQELKSTGERADGLSRLLSKLTHKVKGPR